MSKNVLFKVVIIIVSLIMYAYSLETITPKLIDYELAIVNITFFLVIVFGIIIGQKVEKTRSPP